jgi:hypothetical protein
MISKILAVSMDMELRMQDISSADDETIPI